MNIQEAEIKVRQGLQKIYEQSEANAIARLLLENITGSERQRIIYNKEALTIEQSAQLEKAIQRLQNNEPLQYILNHAWFCNHRFFVNKHVLIPRPETEELVMWIKDTVEKSVQIKLLDIGTGSGCIAISLEKLLPEAKIFAIDNSYKALEVAQKNAEELDADVHYIYADILARNNKAELYAPYDVVVSNPPYIALLEKEQMHANVLQHEPHSALFVEDDNPLLFYKTIIDFCKINMKKSGILFFEINEKFGNEMHTLLQQNGFDDIIVKKDLQGKDRMIKATLK